MNTLKTHLEEVGADRNAAVEAMYTAETNQTEARRLLSICRESARGRENESYYLGRTKLADLEADAANSRYKCLQATFIELTA